MSKYIFYWVQKKTCLGVLDIEEIRDQDHETGLMEGGGIEMSIYKLSSLLYLLTCFNRMFVIHIGDFRRIELHPFKFTND